MMMCDTMIYHAMHYDGGDDDDGVAGSRMVRVMTMMMRLCVFIVMVIKAATITIFFVAIFQAAESSCNNLSVA